jgi:hypothetical protein
LPSDIPFFMETTRGMTDDGLGECPVCHNPPVKRRTNMEILLYAVLAAAIVMLVLGISMPGRFFNFIQGIEVEFVEIGNDSSALVAKLDLGNDSVGLSIWTEELQESLASRVNSSAVANIVNMRTKEGEYLKNIDNLINFVTSNVKYREKRNYTELEQILGKYSGDDRAHVILLASLFNGSGIDFRVDLVEDEDEDGRGYRFRTLVGITLPEEEVEKMVIRRIKRRGVGLAKTEAKVWYVRGDEICWYVIDTTGFTKTRKSSMTDTSWVYIGASPDYYANRSHISFGLPLT